MVTDAHPDAAFEPGVSVLQELVGHQGGVYDLVLNEAGDLISAGGDGLIVRWKRNAQGFGERGEALVQAGEPLFCLGLTASGRLMAGTASGALLEEVETAPWKRQQRHEGGTLVITDEATGGADGRWLNRRDGTVRAVFPGRIRCAMDASVAAAHSESAALSGTWVGTSEGSIHHVEAGWILPAHEGAVRALLPWPDKAAIASVGADGRLVLWKAKGAGEPERLLSINAHKGSIYRLAGDADGRWMATCSRDRSVGLWNASTLDLTHRLARPAYPGHTRSVNALCWTGKRTWASAGDDGRILIWSMDAGGEPSF